MRAWRTTVGGGDDVSGGPTLGALRDKMDRLEEILIEHREDCFDAFFEYRCDGSCTVCYYYWAIMELDSAYRLAVSELGVRAAEEKEEGDPEEDEVWDPEEEEERDPEDWEGGPGDGVEWDPEEEFEKEQEAFRLLKEIEAEEKEDEKWLSYRESDEYMKRFEQGGGIYIDYYSDWQRRYR